MTETQQLKQCDGPHRPKALELITILETLPSHIEIRAISIKGQGGGIFIETYHEGLIQVHAYDSGEWEITEITH